MGPALPWIYSYSEIMKHNLFSSWKIFKNIYLIGFQY